MRFSGTPVPPIKITPLVPIGPPLLPPLSLGSPNSNFTFKPLAPKFAAPPPPLLAAPNFLVPYTDDDTDEAEGRVKVELDFHKISTGTDLEELAVPWVRAELADKGIAVFLPGPWRTA